MVDKIIKIAKNYVVIEKIIVTEDRIDTEEFDQERLDIEKIRAQEDKERIETRMSQLILVQKEMDREISKN